MISIYSLNIPSKSLEKDARGKNEDKHHPVLLNILAQELGCNGDVFFF